MIPFEGTTLPVPCAENACPWPFQATLSALFACGLYALAATAGAQPATETIPPQNDDGEPPPTAGDTSSPQVLDPIVVSVSRKEQALSDVPRAVLVIDRETIERYTRQSSNLSTTLGKLIPGFGLPVFQNSTRSLTLRGREALLLIDGVPLASNAGFGRELSNFDPNIIERIEVLYGPTALYGNGATGGVIQFFTKAASKRALETTLEAGVRTSINDEAFSKDSTSYRTVGTLTGTTNAFDYVGSISLESANGFFDADGKRIAPSGLDDSDDLNLFGKLGFDLSDTQRLEATVNYTNLTFNAFDFVAVSTDGASLAVRRPVSYREEPHQENLFANLVYSDTDLYGNALKLQAYYRETDLVQLGSDLRGLPLPAFFPSVWQTSLDTDEIGFRGDITRDLFDRASLTLGADYSDQFNSTPLLVSSEAVFGATSRFDASTTRQQAPQFDLRNTGVFVQGNLDITDDLVLSGGVRYDRFAFDIEPFDPPFDIPGVRPGGSGSADGVSLNAGVSYALTPTVTAFVSFAQGFSLPDISIAARQVAPGVPIDTSALVEPVEVDSYEAGIRGSLGITAFSLAGFYAESDDGEAVGIDPTTGTGRTQRAPQRNYGVEAALQVFPTDALEFGLSVSWQEGENDVDNDGDFDALSSLEVPPVKVSITGQYQATPDLDLGFQVLVAGDRSRAFDDGVDGFEVDGYTTVDLRAGYRLPVGGLELQVTNLFNEDYLPAESQSRLGFTANRRFAAPGRALALTYRTTF